VKRAVALALLSLAAWAAQGQVYKWVDEKGVTHYSESPPPDNKKATKVDTGPSVAPAPARDDWKQKELDSKRRTLEKHQADEASQKKAAYDENVRKGRCRSAQRDLQILETQAPVYQTDDRGQRKYLEDRDRSAGIARARHDVETYCR